MENDNYNNNKNKYEDKGNSDHYYELMDEEVKKDVEEGLIDEENQKDEKRKTNRNIDVAKEDREKVIKDVLTSHTNSISFPYNFIFMLPIVRLISIFNVNSGINVDNYFEENKDVKEKSMKLLVFILAFLNFFIIFYVREPHWKGIFLLVNNLYLMIFLYYLYGDKLNFKKRVTNFLKNIDDD
jgi:hypothetical protein